MKEPVGPGGARPRARGGVYPLLATLPAVVWVFDRDGALVDASAACDAPLDALLGFGWRAVVPAEDADALVARLGGGAFALELRVRRADGSFAWTQLRGAPTHGPGGALHWLCVHTDVDVERRAVSAVRVAERELQLVTDHMPGGVARVDRDLRYRFVTAAVSRALGRPRERILGGDMAELLGPERFARVEPYARRALAGERVAFEWHYPCTEGGEGCCDMTFVPDREAGGFLVFTHDLTERRRAELALAASHRELELVCDSLPGPVSRVDRDLRYRFVNRYSETICGRPRHELLGRSLADVVGAERFAAIEPFARRALAGEAVSFERQFRTAAGRVEVGLTHFVPERAPDGTVVGFVSVGIDLTARRQAEAQARVSDLALTAISQGVLLTDPEGQVLWVNDAFESITGYRRADILGTRAGFLGGPQTDPAALRDILAAFRARRPIAREIYSYRADGTRFWDDMSLTPLTDDAGAVTHFVVITRDISARKQAEEERARLEGQLQHAQKLESVGRLAGGVAHDFNNMLGVILGHVGLALEDLAADHPVRTDLEEIQRAAERSAALTRQLLAFARRQPITPRSLDLNAAIAGTLTMLQRLIGEAVRLVWRPGNGVWPVRIDVSQLEQVLANLCVNARDAIGGAGTIVIATANRRLDGAARGDADGDELPAGDYVELAVTDTGRGMDDATRARVFEPFFTTKAVGEGTGLGLAIVYGVMKQNGGRITVTSAPGAGTTFALWWPRDADVALPIAPIAAPVRAGTETILVVEDEPALLGFARRALSARGYTVLGAANPRAALALAEAHTGELHLVLSDVVMPDMDGLEMCARLEARHPGVRRVFMSGYAADVVLDPTARFVQKPFTTSQLLAEIRAALDAPR